ncbi:hypothetical protein F4809DRAFT_612880 [Biscogniauxia mediterranea]|nr:hypothetical protein F4809DRAFT_612880 [Biscogniauxia mediterranea]
MASPSPSSSSLSKSSSDPPELPYTVTKLSSHVAIFEPRRAHVQPQAASAPNLILVASWMGARDVHIIKYITQYSVIYPSSPILLVKFDMTGLFASVANKTVQPAVWYLRSLIDSEVLSAEPTRPEILVHIFSNGGCTTMQTIYHMFRRDAGQAFPLHAAVYDSCPGLYVFRTTYSAFLMGFPPGVLRMIGAPLIVVVLIFLSIWHSWPLKILTGDDILSKNSTVHNDPSLVKQTNRSYIYGTADAMVDCRHVEAHFKAAMQKGFDVRGELFDQSPHVAHMRHDGDRYWKIVTDTWEKTIKTI